MRFVLRLVLLPALLLVGPAACLTAGTEGLEPAQSRGGKADDYRLGWGARGPQVIQEIANANSDLSAADLATKMAAMIESPFVFFRGTNHLYWIDLGQDARLEIFGGDEDTRTFLCGDLHAMNYGSFHDDDGRVAYDLNDFDEALVADYQLDIWRMATSIVLLARDNGLEADDIESAVRDFAESYLDRMREVSGNDDEEEASIRTSNAFGRLDDFLQSIEDEDRADLLDKWTTINDGERVFDLDNAKLEDASDIEEEIREGMHAYGETLSGRLDFDESYFAIKSVAKRLRAGTGSLGTPRYYALIEGPTEDQDDDILLDIKRQASPTGLRYVQEELRETNLASFEHPAQRVALAQRALSTDVDDHVGWMELSDGFYSVRERSPYKESFPLEELDSPRRLANLAQQWGEILATDHARADVDFGDGFLFHSVDEAITDRVDGEHRVFRDLVWELAESYADQVETDYQTFLNGVSLPSRD